LACQSKLLFIAYQPKQLANNPQMVGHFLTNMHMGAFVYVVNLLQHELIPLINPTWDLKILGPYPHVKDFGTSI